MQSASRTSIGVGSAGIALLVLGVWGAVLPFAGPAFGYGMGGGPAWAWTESHATLHLLPGLAAVAGALLLLRSSDRANSAFGAFVAVLAGGWFVIGPSLHPLWAGQSMGGMMGMGDSALSTALSELGYHYGTGAVIAVVAAYALGALATRQGATADVPAAGSRSLVDTRR